MTRAEFEKRAKRGYIAMTLAALVLVGLDGFYKFKNPKATLLGLAVGLAFAWIGWFIGLQITRRFFNFGDSQQPRTQHRKPSKPE
jgi:uncharacterized membrane protein AbrB (regulator of aidB expression)